MVREGYIGKEQNETLATYYPQIRTTKDSEIDPKKTLSELYNSIRACNPEKLPAFFYIDGQKLANKLFRPNKP